MFQGSGNTRAATGKRHRLLQQQRVAGSSPDFNPAEDLTAIIKDRVEDRMLNKEGRGRYSHQTLLSNLQTVLHDLEHDSELFAENYCHSGTGWMLLLLLLATTRITNLYFFLIQQYTSV